MQGLPELRRYLENVTFHGALVFNIPSPHSLVLPVLYVDVEGRMVGLGRSEYKSSNSLDTHGLYYQT
jgi:hypothetical protein